MRYPVHIKLNKDFVKQEGNKITIGVRAKPEGGKANEELLKKIARHFKVPVSSVRIVSGRISRNKIIEVL
ncbi:MAG: DUF167 domain-containing protein [bacterium]|nr:DUF167 domain-containing protein [bacterium]